MKRISLLTKTLNGKRVNVCDYGGICTNKAYREVYPMLLKRKFKKRGWSYLCRKHFQQEFKRFKGKLPYSTLDH
ncbi:hypothetical protein HYW75_00135 [Candidatus Pacearchaeota archaeon]|nr:hypothetical protein [Candidatus Pacearchaeota archaeon]